MKKTLWSLVCLLNILVVGRAETRMVLQNGHTGPILSMAKDEQRQVLFTGGKDGSLRVWRGSPLTLVKKIQISHLPLQALAVDEKNQRIGVVESNGITQHYLSVWDWETGKRRFQIPLAEFPLFLQFSPQGTFIGIGKPTWQSLLLLDGETGNPLPYLQEGFGIVNFFLVSSSENTLMSYSPASGSLIYWNLREGSRKSTIRTMSDLKGLTILTERYAAGFDSRSLHLLDLVSGESIARMDAPQIVRVLADPVSGELFSLHAVEEESYITSWKYRLPYRMDEGGFLAVLKEKQQILPSLTSQAILFQNRILVGFPDGTLGNYSPTGVLFQTEGKRTVEPITDMHSMDGQVVVATTKDLWFLNLSFLSQSNWNQTITGRIANSLGKATGLVAGPSGIALAYTKDQEGSGTIAYFQSQKPEDLVVVKTLPSSLRGVWVSEKGWYCLEKRGRLSRLSLDLSREDWQVTMGDLQTLVPLTENSLLLGKNAVGFYGHPLVILDTSTQETIPLQVPGVFLVFDLLFHPPSERVFALALRQGKDRDTETVLMVADVTRIEHFKPIAVLRSEDLEVDFAMDFKTGALLTTLGTGSLRKWDGSFWTSFESNNNLPSQICVHENWVLGLNKDGTASIWDNETHSYWGDIVFLQGGGWLILKKDGQFRHSPEVRPSRFLQASSYGRGSP